MSATAILSHKTFSLCGHGDPYHDCQDLLYFGCKNEHGYFNEAKGKAYVKVVKRNCGRLECPKCLDKVTTNKARKIQKRLKAWKVDRLTIKHIIVSPNPKETKYMDYPDIKTKLKKHKFDQYTSVLKESKELKKLDLTKFVKKKFR